MSADLPDATEPHDPALDGLVRALTADGTARELAARPAALAMFRDSRVRRVRRPRWALSISTAAAAIVVAGGLAAAYTAAFPAPVQHIAYRVLGRIGVPDTHRPAPSSRPPGVAASIPAARPTLVASGCECQGGRPGADTTADLVLVMTRAQIPAGGDDILSGRLAPGGRPEAGVRVRLLEHAGDRPGWRTAGHAVTDRSGAVTLRVHLTSNASFRLAAPGGAMSPPVVITVIPPVHLGLAAGQRPGLGRLTARAPFADTGDVVVLEERSEGHWYRVGERVLGRDHLASFSVLIPRSGDVTYRAVLPRTAAHGSSVSDLVRMAAAKPRTGRRARS